MRISLNGTEIPAVDVVPRYSGPRDRTGAICEISVDDDELVAAFEEDYEDIAENDRQRDWSPRTNPAYRSLYEAKFPPLRDCLAKEDLRKSLLAWLSGAVESELLRALPFRDRYDGATWVVHDIVSVRYEKNRITFTAYVSSAAQKGSAGGAPIH